MAADDPDPEPELDMAEFGRFVALKAVISTFDELLNSCTRTGVCLMCDSGVSEDGMCHPGCVRVRAERAMTFLTKGNGGG